ncbi:MAG TPA: SURF1 family protein [Alphaproteobacteria bacterium]|nr:SURF1 family protein [Alphaproteobacteria bacterium]
MKAPAFRIFGGTFTVRPGATIATLIATALLIGLGVWQIHRLHWKEGLIAEMHRRMQEPAIDIDLSSIPAAAVPKLEYRNAHATGLFENERELYMLAVSKDGGYGGYHVLTPMKLTDGRELLVDRGWIPYADKDPATRARSQFSRPITVHGVLRLPHAGMWPAPANDPAKGVWYRYNLKQMAATEGKKLLPFVLEADNTPNPAPFPLGGQARVTLPNHHYAYILTWFGLAYALVIIYGINSWRRDPREAPQQPAQEAAAENEEKPE